MEWAIGILALLGVIVAGVTPGDQTAELTDCAVQAVRFRQQIELNGEISPGELRAFQEFTRRCRLIPAANDTAVDELSADPLYHDGGMPTDGGKADR